MSRIKTIVITGCSSIGKTTLAKMLLAKYPNISLVNSYTTREKRAEDINYFYLTPDEFKQSLELGEFADYNEVYTNTFYGTKWESLHKLADNGKIPLLVTDNSGATNYFNITDCLVINLVPKDIELIKERILAIRSDNVAQRLEGLNHLHLNFGNEYCFVQINEVIETIYDDIEAFI
jgi:guanylate kinase